MDDLSVYLAPRGQVPQIGPEVGPPGVPKSGFARYRSRYGSTRYLMFRGGAAVSVLQVVSEDGRHALIANVYTLPAYRRMGCARRLLERARDDFASVEHSKHLSESGRAWKGAVRDRTRHRRAGRA